MKAIVMTAVGAPEVLQARDLPQPELNSGSQVRIQLHNAGINPVDTKLRQRGTLFPHRLPAILGCDGSGTVVEVGSDVNRLRVGDPVFWCYGGIGDHPGNYAESIVVPETVAALKPPTVTFADAAAVPLALITAWEALHDRGRLRSGQRVLIHAGAGGVGHVAIQLAKLAGAQVCTTVSSHEKATFVRALGADQAILYQESDVKEAVLHWSGGEGIDLVLDTVGGSLFYQAFELLRPYGDLVTLLQPDPKAGDWKEARIRNLRISQTWMLAPMFKGWTWALEHQRRILEKGGQLMAEGKLRIQVSHRFPLTESATAHRLLEQGGMIGKIILDFN